MSDEIPLARPRYAATTVALPSGGRTSPILVCNDCGAAIGDSAVHDIFHEGLLRPVSPAKSAVRKAKSGDSV